MTDHILVIHRWRDSHAPYASYIDHSAHRVSYITTELARVSISDAAAAVRTVAATDDLAQVLAATRELMSRFGQPTRVIALNEGDLDTAAELRAAIGCAGDDPARLARFRDKLTMAESVATAGISVPTFADAPDRDAVIRFADVHGWPLIVKPRRGTASRGVIRLDSVDDLARFDELPAEPRLVQEYCGDQIFHVDGLWTGTELGPWRASRYLNTCVEFTTGEVLGSVEVDDQDLLAPLEKFTASVAGALSDRPWVFHLEVFVGANPDGSPRLSFLEVGARVGGAEIPFVWREVHGLDLMSAAVDVQLGRVPTLSVPDSWRTGGWLLVPTPVPAPCRVVSS
jgi:biotin carboxylase